jgi:flagellar biosynthesis GTPase FlhF
VQHQEHVAQKTFVNVETGNLKSGDLKLLGVKSDRARTFGRGRHPEVNSICFKLVNLNISAYNKMPNIYSKPITNYSNRVVTPRDERDYQRNIESYKIRKDAEQDDAAERNEELVKKKQKRQRDNKNQKLREKRKRSSESVLREELIVKAPEITHNNNNSDSINSVNRILMQPLVVEILTSEDEEPTNKPIFQGLLIQTVQYVGH